MGLSWAILLVSLGAFHEVVVRWQLHQKSYEAAWGHRKAGHLLHGVPGPLDAMWPLWAAELLT